MVKRGYTELTLNLLEKSPEAGHLLVKIHDKHKLYSLAQNSEAEDRVELAGIIAELINIDLTPPENELIIDVLMSLLRKAEADLRRAVAERLSVMEDVPLRLIVHLANDKISVADPVLRRSRVLDDKDLIYIIKAQAKEHWQAIATRPEMSDELIDILADTRDLDTAVELTQNKSIKLTNHAMDVFSGMAEASDRLAEPLLMRQEFPGEMAAKLYSFVGRELKEYIKIHYETIDNGIIEQAVDDIVFEMVAVEQGEYTPTVKMMAAAENMLARGLLNSEIMVENLRRGQISNFVAMFSVYCGLSVETVIEILHQKTARSLAVVCKATGIMKPEFANMFLLTSRIRGGKVIDQKILARALAYYDKVKEPVAKKILNQSRH